MIGKEGSCLKFVKNSNKSKKDVISKSLSDKSNDIKFCLFIPLSNILLNPSSSIWLEDKSIFSSLARTDHDVPNAPRHLCLPRGPDAPARYRAAAPEDDQRGHEGISVRCTSTVRVSRPRT